METWVNASTEPTIDDTLSDPIAGGNVTWRYTLGGKTISATWAVDTVHPPVDHVFKLQSGRIMASAGAYYGQFFVNPVSQVGTWYGPDSAMSPYWSAEVYPYTYTCGYGNGRITRYREGYATPWTTGTIRTNGTLVVDTDSDANPKYLFSCKGGGAGDLSPLASIDALECSTVGPRNRIYFTGQDRRAGKNWGILVCYDPVSGAKSYIQQPFKTEQTDYVVASTSKRFLVISCHREADGDGILPKPDSGVLYVYDSARANDTTAANMAKCLTRAICPAYGSKGAGNILMVGNKIIGWQAVPTGNHVAGFADSTTQSYLYRYDCVTGAREEQVTVNWPSPWNLDTQGEDNCWSLGPDGKVYCFGGADNKTLYRIDPLHLTSQTAVGTVTHAGQIAWSGKSIYLAGATNGDLRYISSVAP
jgi:hypothetical protein